MNQTKASSGLRANAIDDFFGFCDGLDDSSEMLLTVAWRGARAQLTDYRSMLEVIRMAREILKEAMKPSFGVVDPLRVAEHPKRSASPASPTASTSPRLGAQGHRIATLFKACKAQAGRRAADTAAIMEAARKIGWNATIISSNLAAHCEGTAYPELWERDEKERKEHFRVWEEQAGRAAEKMKNDLEALWRVLVDFRDQNGIVMS